MHDRGRVATAPILCELKCKQCSVMLSPSKPPNQVSNIYSNTNSQERIDLTIIESFDQPINT
eukprot:848845-Pelagomonas_calceolata.AAC.5